MAWAIGGDVRQLPMFQSDHRIAVTLGAAMVKIEVEEQAAEVISRLRAQAQARQVPFDQYLRALAESGSSAPQADAPRPTLSATWTS